jgi:hypothetical protein
MKTMSVAHLKSCVMNSMAEITSHGYMPTPTTILKLQVLCFIYPFTVAVNKKHGRETF